MFESLKKKLSAWLGKPVKKAEKASSKAKKLKKEKSVKKAEEKIKEIEIPQDFNPATQKYEPNLEKIKEVIEQVEEEEVKEEKKEGFFSRLFKKFQSAKISEQQFGEIFAELEMILLENNVALAVVDKIRETLSKDLIGKEIKKSDAEAVIIKSLKEAILSVLIEPPILINQIKEKSGVYTILFFGINGSGKTTSIAKLAHLLKKNGISCVMAAADTFRAASIEQLKKHGERLGVPVVAHDYGSDPSAVAFDAKKYAETNHLKCVLIDTAGRMYTKTNLLKEMEKIVRVSAPDLKIFVGESITGNDATEQAKIFNETAGIDGIILSKADVDEKAGTILSVSYITKKPIYFLGVGQSYDDLKPFKKVDVLKNLGLE